MSIPVPGLGVGALGGSASAGSQTITDHYASTGSMLSGLYAGAGGLDVTIAGNTMLTAGVLSSGAAANDNHFSTGSLTAGSETNISHWSATESGASFSAGAGSFGSTLGTLGAVGTGLVSGASGLLGGGRTHEQTSLSQSAIGSNITVDAGSVSGSYSRDPGSANGHLANAFDPTALGNALQAQQLGGQLVGEVGGQVSDQLAGGNPAFAEGGVGRVGLETAGNAIVAAVTGGNVGAAALGTAAGGLASAATRDWAQSVASGLTTDPAAQTAVANALSNGVASVAGAAGGLLGGAGKGNASVNALNGAAAASAVQQFNQDEDNKGEQDPATVAISGAGTETTGTSEVYSAAPVPDQSAVNPASEPAVAGYTAVGQVDGNGTPLYRDSSGSVVAIDGTGQVQAPSYPSVRTDTSTATSSGMTDQVDNAYDPVTGVHLSGVGTGSNALGGSGVSSNTQGIGDTTGGSAQKATGGRATQVGSNGDVSVVATNNPVATEPNTAFFWSGRTNGIGGQEVAAQIAQLNNGTTLETLIEQNGIQMPAWDASNPAVVQA